MKRGMFQDRRPMVTRLTVKGRVALPHLLRRRLGIRPGDLLDVTNQGGSIVLTPRLTRVRKPRIIADPLTGLPVLTVSETLAPLSSRQVEETLTLFP